MYQRNIKKIQNRKACKVTQRVKPKTCQRMNGGHGLALQAVLGHRQHFAIKIHVRQSYLHSSSGDPEMTAILMRPNVDAVFISASCPCPMKDLDSLYQAFLPDYLWITNRQNNDTDLLIMKAWPFSLSLFSTSSHNLVNS